MAFGRLRLEVGGKDEGRRTRDEKKLRRVEAKKVRRKESRRSEVSNCR